MNRLKLFQGQVNTSGQKYWRTLVLATDWDEAVGFISDNIYGWFGPNTIPQEDVSITELSGPWENGHTLVSGILKS